MKRRHFLSLVALVLLPTSMTMAAGTNATLDYTPGLIDQQLAAGKTLLVDYAASWCGTCASQARTIEQLRKENPAYNQKITFVRVDWDSYESDPVTTSRNIPRRSTLLVLKGKQELGRIVAGTDKQQIKALLDKAL